MKKYLKIATFFAALGIAGGVFYREYSKFKGVDNGFNILGLVHPHFLVLGVIMVLVLGLVICYMKPQSKLLKPGLICYCTGTAGAGIMLFIRGIIDIQTKVSEYILSKGLHYAVSGISGMFHIAFGVGFVLILIALLKAKEPEQ